MKSFEKADFDQIGKTVLLTLNSYLPGKEHGLTYLV